MHGEFICWPTKNGRNCIAWSARYENLLEYKHWSTLLWNVTVHDMTWSWQIASSLFQCFAWNFPRLWKRKKIPFILVLQESSLDDLSPSLIIQIRLFWNISKDWSLKSIATTISFKKARCRSAIASRVLLELCRPSGVGRWTVELLEHRSLSAGKHSGVRADLDCVEKAFGEAFERRLKKNFRKHHKKKFFL